MSNRKARVHMCKISQLITGRSDSRPISLHSPVYHSFGPPHSSPRLCILQPRQGQLKDMMPPHHKIYERFAPVCLPVYRMHRLPRGAASIPSGLQSRKSSIECQRVHEPSSLSPVTGANWEANTGCIQLKPQSFTLTFCCHTGRNNLVRWHEAES